jgi:kynureninase
VSPVPPLDRKRAEFPALARGIHLLSHSLGPVPRAAPAALAGFLQRWEDQIAADPWAADAWWDLPRRAGERIARLLGAPPGSVQVQPNASVALSVAASCVDFSGPRRRVVTGGLDFPTTGYVWEALRPLGAEVVVVPSDDGIVLPIERVLQAIDGRTAIVALSHVSYRSSHRLDPRPLVETARRHGALVLLDVYQSAGVLEIDAAGWGVDFLIGGTIKWLCGGPSCGYLYVRPDLAPRLRPRLTGWFAHDRPFDFEPGPIRYAADARRFAQGTPAIPALCACLPGLELLDGIGVAAVAAESRRRTAWIVERALERGWPVRCPRAPEERGGVVLLGVDRPDEVARRLRERRVLVDWRPGAGIRLGPHFFNTDEEIEAALAALADLLR